MFIVMQVGWVENSHKATMFVANSYGEFVFLGHFNHATALCCVGLVANTYKITLLA